MHTPSLLFCSLVSALFSAGVVSANAADDHFYDPTNTASSTGFTSGYTMYRTIGCPGRETLGAPCQVAQLAAATPVAQPATRIKPTPTAIVSAKPVRVVVPISPMYAQTQQYCGILDFQFEIDQDEIQLDAREKLAAVGAFLMRYPESTALIEGHSDNVGTPEHNLKLSQGRADNVVRYLIENSHISPERLSAVGYGDTRPLVENDSELGRRMNRRIDAIIACATDVAGLTVLSPRLTMASQIEFDQNKADLKPEFDNELSKVAYLMKVNPLVTASVEGHAGNQLGSPEFSLEISRQRAQNVVDTLIEKFNIDRSRLTVAGFGQSRRVTYSTSLDGSQENRRVNIIFTYPY